MDTPQKKKMNLGRLAQRAILGVVYLALGSPAFADATWTIRNTSTGGDCVQMGGSWDPNTKTCSFNSNILLVRPISDDNPRFVEILDNGITLDGNGAMIGNASETTASALYVSHRSDVVIKNFDIRSFHFGINIISGSSISILNNQIVGFEAFYDPETSNVETFGILSLGENQVIQGNWIEGYEAAIGLLLCHNTILKHNTLSLNEWGLREGGGSGNILYNNNFFENSHDAYITGGIQLNIHLPYGGNYWKSNSFGSAGGGGCWDDNSDNICDDPYHPTGEEDIKDEYPWVSSDGWEDSMISFAEIVGYLKVIIQKFDLSAGVQKSLMSKIQNAQKSYIKENNRAAVNQLEALINFVEAKRNKKINDYQANEVVIFSKEAIRSIIAVR